MARNLEQPRGPEGRSFGSMLDSLKKKVGKSREKAPEMMKKGKEVGGELLKKTVDAIKNGFGFFKELFSEKTQSIKEKGLKAALISPFVGFLNEVVRMKPAKEKASKKSSSRSAEQRRALADEVEASKSDPKPRAVQPEITKTSQELEDLMGRVKYEVTVPAATLESLQEVNPAYAELILLACQDAGIQHEVVLATVWTEAWHLRLKKNILGDKGRIGGAKGVGQFRPSAWLEVSNYSQFKESVAKRVPGVDFSGGPTMKKLAALTRKSAKLGYKAYLHKKGEGPALTAEEQKQFDAYKAEGRKLEEKIQQDPRESNLYASILATALYVKECARNRRNRGKGGPVDVSPGATLSADDLDIIRLNYTGPKSTHNPNFIATYQSFKGVGAIVYNSKKRSKKRHA